MYTVYSQTEYRFVLRPNLDFFGLRIKNAKMRIGNHFCGLKLSRKQKKCALNSAKCKILPISRFISELIQYRVIVNMELQ